MKQRTKTVALCIIAIAVAITIAMPQKISAASDPKKPEATNVVYVTDDNDKKTGIKSFTISPFSYYNLSQDRNVNSEGERTLKLNDAKLLQIAKSQIFPKWSIIAEGIFREQADQLVTIEGSKMMSSSTAVAESFDRHFCTGKVSNGYISEDWSVDDLADELRQEKSSQKGKTCWDEVRVTGITQIDSLNGARTLMGQELRNCSDDDDVSKDDFLGNNHQKNEDKRRLPDLEDDKSGDGFANIVTCVNRAGASGDYDYVTFGLAVYGFDITPVAAENLKYVEAADETFPDGESIVKGQDILMGLAGDHIEKTGISFHNDEDEGTTSFLRNNTTQEVTQSSGLENSVTEESTLSTDETFEWGMEQEIGLELNLGGFGGIGAGAAENPAPCMFPRATVSMSNSWHELWSTTKSKSETQSATKTKNTNTELTLPGHTVAVVKQSLNNTKTSENYQQPVILSYKVAIFAMSGDYFNGAAGGIENSRYDKQWMSVIFDGSDDYETSGCKALGSLYNRAIVNKDTQGYDGAKGRYKTWCDKAAWVKSSKIDWNDISTVLSLDNRASHRITLGNGKKATTVKDLATELPLIEKAQMLTSKRESITSSVEEILPLYSLKSVGVKKGEQEYELTPGNTLYLNSIDLEGYNKYNAEFYEFDKDWGEWVLLDKDGDAIEDNQDGAITLVKDSNLDTQKVVVAPDGQNITEDHYLGWKLKDSAVITSNEELNRPERCMTIEEKGAVETPTILVHVKYSNNDIDNFEIGGTYKGAVGESVNLNHVLTADAVDSTGKIRGVPVYWESKGTTGITVDQSGQTTFTKKGTYQVRPYSFNTNNEKIVPRDDNQKPVWLEVVAQDKASLSSIVIHKPDFEATDTTLSEGITALGFDLASYTKFLDQYGEKWEGTDEDPLPVVKYSVSGPNGADIDRENILTITRPGTYKVTAKAYDQDGNDTGINIAPITIEVSEQEYLASITMDEPAMSRNELTLKDQDCIVVENLKGLLTYLDQNEEEWTGKKPNVTFSIAGEPSDAQIKGGNFYAYAPGTYTIVPSAEGYNINTISITIEEDSHLVLKSEDPGKQFLYSDDDEVELELERFIDATTGYGGKWKGKIPELKFTLDNATGSKIETKTVYDGEDDYVGTDKHFFKSNVPGEYIVHVQPQKASEYTEPIDDILVKVVKGKKIARIEFKDIEKEVDLEDLVVNVDGSDYPSIDFSKYLNYYDGFDNLIDPAKDHVKIPDCKYELQDSDKYKEDEYDLKGGTLTTYVPDYYAIKATMNVTNYDPKASGEEAKEDTFLEATTDISFYDINWMHHFSDWVTIEQPTCTEDGERVKQCDGGDGCMYHKDGEEHAACDVEIVDAIPATGHKWSDTYSYVEDKNYLCTVCEICGEKNEASITPCPEGIVDPPILKTEPTCTTGGEYEVTTEAGDTVTVTVPALGHLWDDKFSVTKAPTCAKLGQESIECTRCHEATREGEEYHRTIPKLEHVPGNWEYYVDEDGREYKETCEDYGIKVAICTNMVDGKPCDETLIDLIMPIGHKWKLAEESEPTCAQDGVKKYVCEHDATHTKTEFIPAEGHEWDEGVVTTKPTAEHAGVKTYTCKKCKATRTEVISNAKEAEAAARKAAEANKKAPDGTACGKGAGAAAAEKAITSARSDNDPAGSSFSILKVKSGKQTRSSITLNWTKAKGATTYMVFGNACGKNNKMIKLATLGNKNRFVVKKISKKLKKGTYHKFIVVALDKNDKVVSTSKIIHVATTGGKVTNPKKVTVKNGKKATSKLTVKKGKTVKVASTVTKASKKLKLTKHRVVMYESSNKTIASVGAKTGKIKGIKKGTCYIDAYTQSGVYKRIKVTVK